MNTTLLLTLAERRLAEIKEAIEKNDTEALIACAVCGLCTEEELMENKDENQTE